MYDQIGHGGFSREGEAHPAARRARGRVRGGARRAGAGDPPDARRAQRRAWCAAASPRSTSTRSSRGCSSPRVRPGARRGAGRGGSPARVARNERRVRQGLEPLDVRRPRSTRTLAEMDPDAQSRAAVGYKRAMTNARRFQIDELTLRPGTYFNPQTEIMIVVDDSPEVDHELFEMRRFDAEDWVLIAEDAPVDEHRATSWWSASSSPTRARASCSADDDETTMRRTRTRTRTTSTAWTNWSSTSD